MNRCIHCKAELDHPREADFPHYLQQLNLSRLESIVYHSHLARMGNTYYKEAGYSCFDTVSDKLANVASLLDTLRTYNHISPDPKNLDYHAREIEYAYEQHDTDAWYTLRTKMLKRLCCLPAHVVRKELSEHINDKAYSLAARKLNITGTDQDLRESQALAYLHA